MPGLLYLDKRKPIPGEWEYDIHPYFGPSTEYAPYESAPPENMPPLYQGEQGGLMDDWIPSPTDPGEFFPIDDPSWSTEISPPVRAWGPPSGGVPGSTPISQHMADWILTNYPEQETWDRYHISGWDRAPGAGSYADDPGSWTPLYNNPILSYNIEISEEYRNSPEYKDYIESITTYGTSPSTTTPPLSSLPIIPISDSTTTPLPYVPPPSSEDYFPPEQDYSAYPPLDSYDYPGPVYSEEEYAAYLDSLPPTTEPAPLSIAYDSYSGSPYTY